MATNPEEDALADQMAIALESVDGQGGTPATRKARAYQAVSDGHAHEIVVAMYRKIKALRQQVISLGGTPV